MATAPRGPGGRFVSRQDWANGVQLLTASMVEPRAIMRSLARDLDGDMRKKLNRYVRQMRKDVSLYSGIEEANKRIAEGARRASLQAYRESGIGKRPSYRQNDVGKLRRYSDGAMERAMEDPSFAIGKGRPI